MEILKPDKRGHLIKVMGEMGMEQTWFPMVPPRQNMYVPVGTSMVTIQREQEEQAQQESVLPAQSGWEN